MITTKGRLVYIEPNDMRNQLSGQLGSGDNVSWRPEDLNISVDLQVFVPDRDSCGAVSVGDNFLVNISGSNDFERKWQTFFKGTELAEGQNYLTTEYTNISFQEIRGNKAGGKESLGVQSIDIQFDSHFFPIVKMKIIDVRGYSLMMPAETQYDENVKADAQGRSRRVACEQFFDAVFHFPYPRFALSIKGYYGDRVTLMLAVNEFQSAFNSQTGNFEVEISFIGHMFGVYADLPTSFLFVAPYIGSTDGGVSQYWKTQTAAGGAFHFADGTPIPTFKEFVENFDRMNETFSKAYGENPEEYEHLNKVENLNTEERLLSEVISEYEKLFTTLGNQKAVNSFKTISNLGYLYFTEFKTVTLPSKETLDKKIDEYNTFAEKDLTTPNDKNEWGKQVETKEPLFVGDNEKIVDKHPYKKELEAQLLDIGINVRNKNVLFLKKDNNFIGGINRRQDEIENEIVKGIGQSTKEINEISKKILGFVPSIENVIRMIFAHIDAFVTEFYTLLDTIKGKMNNERLLKNIKYRLEDTNISSNGTDKCFIPPFTAFYKKDPTTKEKVRVYPGSVSTLSGLDEVKFIEKIFNAVTAAKIEKYVDGITNEGESSDNPIAEEKKDEWLHLSVLDLLQTKNPYRSEKISTNPSDIISTLTDFVSKRLEYAQLTGVELSYSNIANEVDNFLKIHKKNVTTGEEPVAKVIEEINAKISELTNDKQEGVVEADEEFKKKLGYHIIENPTEEYQDGLKKQIQTNWDFKTNENFTGNIRLCNGCTVTTDKNSVSKIEGEPDKTGLPDGKIITAENRKKYTELSRSEPSKFTFPIVPYYEINENKKLTFHNYFGITKEFNALDFVSTMVGTPNVYRFQEKQTSLVRMPKIVALFLGGTISTYKDENDKYRIFTDGLYYNDDNKRAGVLNEKTVKDLVDTDARGVLAQYYDENERSLKSIWDTAKKGESLNKESAVILNNSVNRELIDKLIELNNTTVDVLYIQEKSDVPKSNINLIAFLGKLKTTIENGKKTENALSSDTADPSTDANSASINSGTAQSKKNQKEQIYYTCADLYDKWFAGYSKDRFLLKSASEDGIITKKKMEGGITPYTMPITEFENFVYIDTFYNDIGQKFLVDPKTVAEILTEVGDRNALQTICDITYKNKLLFIPLPVFTNMYDAKSIASIFIPQGLYGNNEFPSINNQQRGLGSTYVIMYTHQPSSQANTNKFVGNTTTYANDVLDLADSAGNISPTTLEVLSENSTGNNYKLPAFGVTFGTQNQMYFKGINVNMSNPKETEEAVKNRFILASMERQGDSRVGAKTTGQNLYSIYSNRAYDCTVEMMGCMNIMPLLYFQLNNIPLFKGGYRIVSVKHHIENGSMTTTFTGTRINKTAIPYTNNVIDIEGLMQKMKESGGVYSETTEYVHGEGVRYDLYTDGEIDTGLATFDVPAAINAFHTKMELGKPYTAETVFDNIQHYLGRCATGVKLAVRAGFDSYRDWSTKDYKHSIKYSNGTPIGPLAKDTMSVNIDDKVPKWISGYHGWYCREILTKLGFRLVDSGIKTGSERIKPNIEPLPGDIAVTMPWDLPKYEYGHVEMCYGDSWIADCNQGNHGMDVYGRSRKHQWEIYRYGGPTIQVDGYGLKYADIDKEGYDKWVTCCENMKTFYENMVHTHRSRKRNELGDNEGKRKDYMCNLINDNVQDDGPSFILACLKYFGQNDDKYDGLTAIKTNISTTTMQPKYTDDNTLITTKNNFNAILAENGFKYHKAKKRYELKKGDIVCGKENTCAEIIWDEDKVLSWNNINDTEGGGLPCKKSEITLEHVWRFVGKS